jgi:osmotically-inducible protein OsmY
LLSWSAAVPAGVVSVSVADRVITLTGQVTWAFQRAAAADAVIGIRGITAVRNDIALPT